VRLRAIACCRSCNYPLGIEIADVLFSVNNFINGCRSCNYPVGIEIQEDGTVKKVSKFKAAEAVITQ